MKMTRIDIEGPNGTATLTRAGRAIFIEGERAVRAVEGRGGQTCIVKETFHLNVDAWTPGNQLGAAINLQGKLDGYAGTAGDIAAYSRVIELLAD